MNNKPYSIYYAHNRKIKGTFYTGYESQLDVGRALFCKLICDQITGRKKDYKILIFGYPGVGKGTYPYALMKLLTEDRRIQEFLKKAQKQKADLKSKLCLVHVPYLDMSNQYRQPVLLSDKLKALEKDINTSVPCIVVLDELDAFAPQYAKLVSATMHVWTHRFLDKKDRGIIVLGIVNYPVHLYSAIKDKFHQLLYFEPLKQKTVVKILDHFGIPYSKEVAVELCLERGVTARQLLVGIENIIENEDGDPNNLSKLEPEDITDFLLSYITVTKEEIEDYEGQTKKYRESALKSQKVWIDRLSRMLGSL